jgi:hypothetical protein
VIEKVAIKRYHVCYQQTRKLWGVLFENAKAGASADAPFAGASR